MTSKTSIDWQKEGEAVLLGTEYAGENRKRGRLHRHELFHAAARRRPLNALRGDN